MNGSGISHKHLDLISKIYDLPLNPGSWQPVLDEFAPMMNAAGAGVMAFDPIYAGHYVNIVTSNYTDQDPDFVENMNRYSAQEQKGYAEMALDPVRGFVSDMEALGVRSLKEQSALPAVQWLGDHFHVRHRAASCLNLKRVWTDFLAVQFVDDRGPITDHEREIGALFLDHFAKSVELGRAFGVLKHRFDGVFTALDRFHIGIFVLSASGSVVVKNVEAERILDAGDGLSLTPAGHLHAGSDGHRSGELKNAITQAVHTAQAQDNCAETLLTLPRRSGDTPYLVEIAPIRDHDELESQFKGCLVYVIDPTKTDVVTTEGMQALYNLTGSESEICKLLAEGLKPDEVADSRNVSLGTVRSQIRALFEKTQTNSQVDLVRLALTVNLPIDPEKRGD